MPEERATRLLAPLAADLDAWRRASGNPADDALVFPSRRGARWAGHDWDNWRERRFLAAAKVAGLPADKEVGPRRVRPRDLRSSFATLLIYEGQPPQYVAEQLGHSPATLLRDYARVWQEFDPAQRVSAEQQIERVRSRLRRNRVLAERGEGRSRSPSHLFHTETGVPLVFHDDRSLSSRASRNPSKSS